MATEIPQNEATFSLEDLARVTGGKVVASCAERTVRGVSTDSRRVTPGFLYVALRGPTHDGHDFAQAAVREGAAAVLAERRMSLPEGVGAVEVTDTVRSLGDIARAHRQRWGGRVVAITGSAGKTTTKELTAAALSAMSLRVGSTRGNLNNLIGLPMTLFSLDRSVEVAVLELGTSHRGEIARLAEICRPDVGVVTLVAAAHVEGLGGLDAIAEEKGALPMALPPHGVVVANRDDDAVWRYAQRSAAWRKLGFGASAEADVRLSACETTGNGASRCSYQLRAAAEATEVVLRLLGTGAAMDAAAALGVAVAFGAGPAQLGAAAQGLALVEPTHGRLCPRPGEHGTLIIDDTYNASPRATEVALHAAATLASVRGTRWLAVLGDMKELGSRSRAEHEAVGRYAAACGARELVLCGVEMAAAAEVVRAGAHAGVSTPGVHHVASALDAIPITMALVRAGDVVLVKGSRTMAMERVVQALVGSSGGLA